MSSKQCILCGSTKIIINTSSKTLHFRDDVFSINTAYMSCLHCGEDYTTPNQSKKNTTTLVKEYKKKYNLLLGDTLLEIRKKLKLSQNELEIMLGIGKNTIIRYEKDIIPQSKPVDILYRFLARADEYPALANELYPDLDLSKMFKMEEMFTPIELEYEDTPEYYISGTIQHSSKEAA